jgi:DNA-binding NarL/FixJ family response regulator
MTTPPAGAPLRLVIADDQASVRQGLVLLLDAVPDIEVVGAAADGEQALDLVAEHHPDAILLDLHMPVLDGIGAIRRLTAEHPEVAIVVLTTYADDSSVLDALRAGARSYLTKDADYTEIARALRGMIARGMTNPEIAAQLFLSNHTVKTHISRIFAKTGSRDRAAAIGYAHRHGIG